MFGAIYGAYNGSINTYDDDGISVRIEITGGTVGTIYGGGLYYTSVIAGDVYISIENTTITGNIYGGGKGGKITGNVNISISDSCSVLGSVFGGGLGLTDTFTNQNIIVGTDATSGWDTAVSNYNTQASASGSVNWDEAPTGFPIYDKNEILIVIRKYHKVETKNGIYYLYENQAASMLTLSEVYGNVSLKIVDSSVSGDVYGGGSIAKVYGNVDVTINNSTIGGSIYGGGDGVTVPESTTLYIPISDYTALSASSSTTQDSNETIGEFSWTNDTGILNYFAGIYDGVNQVVYNEDGTTTSFATIVANESAAQAVIDSYGTAQLVYSADVDNLGYVGGSITLNIESVELGSDSTIYGGGNKRNSCRRNNGNNSKYGFWNALRRRK